MAKFSHWSLVLRLLITAAPLLLCFKVEPTAAVNPWITKTPMSVLIYNEMPGGVVVVECKCHKCHNLNIALQQQYLPWRKGYEFEFKMSIWGNTYVWCKFVYGQLWNAFKVWTGPGFWGQRKMPCQQCVLVVRTDGIYKGQTGANESLVWVKPWMQDTPALD